ncbi:MAG: PilZ domain-containing protein [Proteobacteria bacterium]|nr:PilZ domain-containing protein [Pseudomonadota bacterium]MBU1585945.1 PilZ domain-containing protein [Pseudomonadota bacterium]MBU2631343.1 PilZ domain-containing protein [Pseudomonadota bacterium]
MAQQSCLVKSKKKTCDEVEVTSRLLNIIFDMPVEQQLDLLDRLDTSGYEGSRRHTRTYLKNPWVVLLDPEKEKKAYDYFIKNISRCGMFIETRRNFLVGEKITMKFQMPASQKLYKLMGEIVRFQKNGIGVKFKRQLSEN